MARTQDISSRASACSLGAKIFVSHFWWPSAFVLRRQKDLSPAAVQEGDTELYSGLSALCPQVIALLIHPLSCPSRALETRLPCLLLCGRGWSYSKHSCSSDNAPVLLAGENGDGAGGEARLLKGAALASHVLGRHCCVCVENCIAVSQYTSLCRIFETIRCYLICEGIGGWCGRCDAGAGVRDKFWACENVTGSRRLGKAIPVPRVQMLSIHDTKTIAIRITVEMNL